MVSKSDLLKTLKKDGTSTGINKEFIAKMLTVTVALECDNITQLTKAQLDELKCGDIVAKKTGNQWHAYVVSYKGDGAGQGICLTYCAAGYIETVSYDRSGNNWVYNSTDVCNITGAPSGTINKVLGLDSSGNVVKGSVSGGTQLYKHHILINYAEKAYPESENQIIDIEIICYTSAEIDQTYKFEELFGNDSFANAMGARNKFVTGIIKENYDAIGKFGVIIGIGYYDSQVYACYIDETGDLKPYSAITDYRDIYDTYDIIVRDTVTPL